MATLGLKEDREKGLPCWLSQFSKGNIHLRRRQIFTIIDSSSQHIFTTIRWQILPNFDPYPPRICRRLKWMVPKNLAIQIFKASYDSKGSRIFNNSSAILTETYEKAQI